jgi:hypothetical protein
VTQDLKDLLEQLVKKEMMAQLVSKELQELQVRKVITVLPVLKVLKVQVATVSPVLREPQVLLAGKVQLVQLVFPTLVQPGPQVPLGLLELSLVKV